MTIAKDIDARLNLVNSDLDYIRVLIGKHAAELTPEDTNRIELLLRDIEKHATEIIDLAQGKI